jgi:methionyl-tRNA synthetase
MSKTDGNVVDPMAFASQYGVDAFRYFLMAEMTLGQDASFTEEAFIRRYNTDLANDLGNILSRVLKMIGKYFDSRVPEPGPEGEDETALRTSALKAAEGMIAAVEGMRIDAGLSGLAAVMRETNRYIEKKQPWVLAKDEAQRETLATVLYTVVETVRIISGMLYPVMPGKVAHLRSALGLPDGAPAFESLDRWGVLSPGTTVTVGEPLFPRIG